MKYLSPILSDARNKLGGSVFARNRSGVYARARVSPTQPRTPSQVANRSNFATITAGWKAITAPQRAGWNALASTRTLTDSLGSRFRPSGFQLYVSCNRNLTLVLQPTIDDAPDANNDPGSWSWQTPTLMTDTGQISEFDVGFQTDADDGNQYALMGCTGALSPGITFVPRHLYRNLFTQSTQNSPWDLTPPWANKYGLSLTTGQQVGVRLQVIDGLTGFQHSDNTFLTIAT